MANIISFPVQEHAQSDGVIQVHDIEIARVRRQLTPGSIQPAISETSFIAVNEHAAEPIKSIDEINRISEYLIANHRYRDNMLFIVGINFGLRISDLLQLKFYMLLDNTLTFRTSFPILEKKTSTTRKVKRNRYITINDAVIDAVMLYITKQSEQGKVCKLDDYLFRSESNRGINSGKPMDRTSVDRVLKGIAKELNLETKVSTHTLRKTFGYHQMVMSGNDPRKLLLLQKMFGHATAAVTLDYIGITTEEIEDAYLNLNLGGTNCYNTFGVLKEASA